MILKEGGRLNAIYLTDREALSMAHVPHVSHRLAHSAGRDLYLTCEGTCAGAEKAFFGLGCYWGAEALFRCTKGVVATRVGFMVRTSTPET